MFETFWPRKFCREFVEAFGHSLYLTSLMGVVGGHKLCADVWVQRDRIRAFNNAARKYRLHVLEDVVFEVVPLKDLPDSVIGKSRLTTTVAYGHRSFPKTGKGSLHVFIAKSRRAAEKALTDGWYPVVVKGRVIDRPLADAYRFGHSLGYPDCCVEFFRRFNNWSRYNFLWEILKNTRISRAHYVCNPFLRNATYTYVAHMPCSYGCSVTRRKAAAFRDFIASREPDFAQAIDRHLQLPFLAFYERRLYAFDGEMNKDGISYKKVYYVGQGADHDPHGNILVKGDRVVLDGKEVIVLKRGRQIGRVVHDPAAMPQEKPFIFAWQGGRTKVLYAAN